MARPLRLAIVGLGRMGAFHLRALRELDEVDVVAVVEPDPAVFDSLHLDGIRAHAGIETLLADGVAEAWLLATPTPTHPSLTAAGLQAGVHVLCEKPLSLEADPAQEVADLAADRGLVLQVGFWRRFSPPWAATRDQLRSGRIGSLVSARFVQWDADPPPAAFCDPAVSGGLAIDCGVHEFDLAEWITGLRVESVRAHRLPLVDPDLGEVGDVDNLLAVLHLEGGSVATVDLSRNARYADDVRTELLGSDGALFVETLPSARLRIGTAAGVDTVPGSLADDAMLAGVQGQAIAFARAVHGDELDIPDAAASTRSIAIARAVSRSMESGDAVAIE